MVDSFVTPNKKTENMIFLILWQIIIIPSFTVDEHILLKLSTSPKLDFCQLFTVYALSMWS